MNVNRKTASTAAGLACAAVAALFLLLPSTPAWPLTGADVLDKMNEDESTGYIAGSVSMTAFLSHVQGNEQRGNCIIEWYYRNGGVKTVVQALDRFKDREALPVIYALIEKNCGE